MQVGSTVNASEELTMSRVHDPQDAIGQVTHYFGQLSVAAVSLKVPLVIGERIHIQSRIHIQGHTTDLVQKVDSMEIDHVRVDRAGPGDDVALKIGDHVRDHDLIFREA